MSRCFNTFTPNTSAGDYLNTTRQKTLFREVNNNIIELNNANPVKQNGFRYNNNFGVRPVNKASSGAQGCLATASSHQQLLDITKGKVIYENQRRTCPDAIIRLENDTPKFDAWRGVLYSVNYAKHNVTDILRVAQINDVIEVDPERVLFFENCSLYPPWLKVVDMSFNETIYSRQANAAQILTGFNYPEQVTFGIF
jgi:hypothetical protein